MLAAFAVIMQFAALRYDYQSQIPSRGAFRTGRWIVETLKTVRDPIFIPTSSYLLLIAGKQAYFHISSLSDLELAAQRDHQVAVVYKNYQQEITSYIKSRNIQTAILPNADWYNGIFSIQNGYKCKSLLTGHKPW
jgi:hypothetical protein